MNSSSLTSGLDFLQTTRILAPLPRKWENSSGEHHVGWEGAQPWGWELLPHSGASYSARSAPVQASFWGGTGSSPCSSPAKALTPGSYRGAVATCSRMSEGFLCFPQCLAKKSSVCFGSRYRRGLGRSEHPAGSWGEQGWGAAGRGKGMLKGELVTKEFCKTERGQELRLLLEAAQAKWHLLILVRMGLSHSSCQKTVPAWAWEVSGWCYRGLSVLICPGRERLILAIRGAGIENVCQREVATCSKKPSYFIYCLENLLLQVSQTRQEEFITSIIPKWLEGCKLLGIQRKLLPSTLRAQNKAVHRCALWLAKQGVALDCSRS